MLFFTVSFRSIPIDLPDSADGGVMFETRTKFPSLVCKGKMETVFPEITAGYFLATVAPGSNWTFWIFLIFVFTPYVKSINTFLSSL